MGSPTISPAEQDIYTGALRALNASNVPYVVGGAAAIGYHTGLWRSTKDLDLFLTPRHITAALVALAVAGYTIEIPALHWLAHARRGAFYIDLIFGFGGWRAAIDDRWYARGIPAIILGQPARVCSVEDLIWIKAYVAHRERFDGADILHLINARHRTIDWDYLVDRFGPCWPLLLFYVYLYRFVYPSDHADIPPRIIQSLLDRWHSLRDQPPADPRECRGPLLDRYSFLVDLANGLRDGREPWALAQGWTRQDLERDREEARRILAAGLVRPDRQA
ncbi:MAG TPA: hypothetical protein VKY56_01675 [Chloroflexota bacterium]|nr:hypothetical protein [Chloroflexota bacterium]